MTCICHNCALFCCKARRKQLDHERSVGRNTRLLLIVKNIWKSYIWTADKDASESDPRSNVHNLGSSENKAWKKRLYLQFKYKTFVYS